MQKLHPLLPIFSPKRQGLDGLDGSLQSLLRAFFRNQKCSRDFAYASFLDAAHNEHPMIFLG